MSTRYLLHLTYDPGPPGDGPPAALWTTDHRRAIRHALQNAIQASARKQGSVQGEGDDGHKRDAGGPAPPQGQGEQGALQQQQQQVACQYKELVVDAVPLLLLAGCWAILLLFLFLQEASSSHRGSLQGLALAYLYAFLTLVLSNGWVLHPQTPEAVEAWTANLTTKEGDPARQQLAAALASTALAEQAKAAAPADPQHPGTMVQAGHRFFLSLGPDQAQTAHELKRRHRAPASQQQLAAPARQAAWVAQRGASGALDDQGGVLARWWGGYLRRGPGGAGHGLQGAWLLAGGFSKGGARLHGAKGATKGFRV